MRYFGNFLRPCAAALVVASMIASAVHAQVTLTADGSADTYGLMDSRGFGIETPDCVHGAFGQHVTQTFDSTLGKYVFVFHSHIVLDNDRCTNFDRVRMEIKGDTGAPGALRHNQGETAYYRWKFRLEPDFIGSSSFTHIFQIKAQGGSDSGSPLITITPRGSIIEVIHTGSSGAGTSRGRLTSTSLTPFRGTWVEAYVRYQSVESGEFEISLKRVSDGQTLLSYSGTGLDMWRGGSTINRPKWGVYRSKDSTKKDEQVRFADFCVSESSASACPGIGGGAFMMGTGITQAEDMTKTGYETNVFEGVTLARAVSTSIGYISGIFSGNSGNYSVNVRHFDENDGQATLTLKVNGTTIASRTLNIDDHAFKDWIIENVAIGSGDEIRVEGAHQAGEHARIDFIQIEPFGAIPDPEPEELFFEAEDLARTSAGASTALQSDDNNSEGVWVALQADGVGDYVEYILPNIPAGTYELRMGYKGHPSRGILQLSIGGSNIGGTLDQYSAMSSYPVHLFGEVSFASSGNQIVRLTVTGRHAASGAFTLSSDTFSLTPVEVETGIQSHLWKLYE